MAKQTSTIKLQGTVGDRTYVSSHAYGDHVRAKRGTYKPAPINETLQQESQRMQMANVPAKLFKDAIEPYRGEMKDGSMWQRLVSAFRKQLKADGKFDFSKLVPFELDEKHTLQQKMSVNAFVTADEKKSRLKIEITYSAHPTFRRAKDVNGYMLSVISVFTDLKTKTASTQAKEVPIRKFKDAVTPLVMQIDIPSKAKEFIICLKIVGCKDDVVNKLRATVGFCVVAGGEI